MFRCHRALLVAGCLTLPVLAVEAQQPRRTITHEDVHLAKRLGGLALSPDGRFAVFSVSEPAYRDEDASSDLWIVPTDGNAPPRRLTSTRGGEGGASWSPDGRRIAFTARREGDEVSQVYVLDLPFTVQRKADDGTGSMSPYPGHPGSNTTSTAAPSLRRIPSRGLTGRIGDTRELAPPPGLATAAFGPMTAMERRRAGSSGCGRTLPSGRVPA